MATCGVCDADIPSHANFCPGCGSPQQARACAACGEPVIEEAAFCVRCGEPLRVTTAALARRDRPRHDDFASSIFFRDNVGMQPVVDVGEDDQRSRGRRLLRRFVTGLRRFSGVFYLSALIVLAVVLTSFGKAIFLLALPLLILAALLGLSLQFWRATES